MKNKLFTTALLFSFLIAACTYTQKVRDGRFAYDRMQYSVAIPMLQKEYKKAKSTQDKGELAFLLAGSYKITNQPANSIDWYKIAYDNNYGVQALKEYAFALKKNQQYDEAILAFKDLGIEIGSPYEYRREVSACKVATGWEKEKTKAYSIEAVSFNSRNSDYAPTLYKDNQLVFTSDRSASLGEESYNWTGNDFSDLFIVDLKTKSVEPFDDQLNTEFNEGTAVFNKDFSEVYFTRCFGNKKDDNYCKLMMSQKSGDRWTVPVLLNFIQDEINYGHPAISLDGSTLYFSCNSKEGWGGYDIWFSERTSDGWGEPILMGRSINSTGNEQFPFIDKDTLYFSSDFHTGMGGLDIFKTYKINNGAWVPVQNLKPPINSGADDFGYAIDYEAAKGKDILQKGFFTSTRFDGKGGDDIYQFEKRVLPPEPPKPKQPEVAHKMILEGYVLEKIYESPDDPSSQVLGRKPLSQAKVTVKFGKQEKKYPVDNNGFFSFELEENQDYYFLASKTNYLNNEDFFSSKGIAKDPNNPIQKFEIEIVLDKIYLNQEIVLEDIYYDFDKWDIRKDAEPTLDKLLRNLQLNPSLRIQLASHTDCRGSTKYNEDLSQKRAQSVVNYLISKDIDPGRLEAKGFGKNQLRADCICSRCSEDEHQKNRRTTFAILEE